jgi:hypothetical protein
MHPDVEVIVHEAVVIGEYTTSAGPYLDDYFLVLVNRLGQMSDIPMGEAREAIEMLERRLGTRLRFQLNNSVDLASRVVYPPELEGSPLLDFNMRSGVRAILEQLRNFGWQEVRKTMSDNVSIYLERISEPPVKRSV